MRKLIWLLTMTVLLVLAAGCTQDKPAAPTPPPQPPAAATKMLTVYLASEDAEHVRPLKVEVPAAEATPQRAVAEMLKADAAEAYPLWSKDTEVLGVTVAGDSGTATVRFNEGLRRNLGGSLGEILRVYMTVNTLTEFPEIKAVRFAVNDEMIATLDGHMDLSEPLTRRDDLITEK